MKLTAENRLIFDLVFDKPVKTEHFQLPNNTFHWQQFEKTAQINGLTALLFQKLKQQNNLEFLPENTQHFLQQHYFKSLQMIVQQQHIYAEILREYGDDFKIIPLKGIFLAQEIYNDAATRQLSDIDILLPKHEGEKLHQLLQENGFTAITEIMDNKTINEAGTELNQHFASLLKNGFMLEIHQHLNFKNTEFDVVMEDVLERLVKKDNRYFLSDFDHLRYLIVHFIKHFRLGNMQLKNLVDITYFIQKKAIDTVAFELFLKEKNMKEEFRKIKQLIDFLKGEEEVQNEYIQGVSEFLNTGTYQAQTFHSLKRFDKIKGLYPKFLYVFLYVFPSCQFLKNQFGKQKPDVFLLYYLKWWKRILRKVILMLRSKILFVP